MRSRLVHVVIQRPVAAPKTVRWYVRYVWLQPGGVARDRVLAAGDMPVDGREGRELIAAALREALDALESDH